MQFHTNFNAFILTTQPVWGSTNHCVDAECIDECDWNVGIDERGAQGDDHSKIWFNTVNGCHHEPWGILCSSCCVCIFVSLWMCGIDRWILWCDWWDMSHTQNPNHTTNNLNPKHSNINSQYCYHTVFDLRLQGCWWCQWCLSIDIIHRLNIQSLTDWLCFDWWCRIRVDGYECGEHKQNRKWNYQWTNEWWAFPTMEMERNWNPNLLYKLLFLHLQRRRYNQIKIKAFANVNWNSVSEVLFQSKPITHHHTSRQSIIDNPLGSKHNE